MLRPGDRRAHGSPRGLARGRRGRDRRGAAARGAQEPAGAGPGRAARCSRDPTATHGVAQRPADHADAAVPRSGRAGRLKAEAASVALHLARQGLASVGVALTARRQQRSRPRCPPRRQIARVLDAASGAVRILGERPMPLSAVGVRSARHRRLTGDRSRRGDGAGTWRRRRQGVSARHPRARRARLRAGGQRAGGDQRRHATAPIKLWDLDRRPRSADELFGELPDVASARRPPGTARAASSG